LGRQPLLRHEVGRAPGEGSNHREERPAQFSFHGRYNSFRGRYNQVMTITPDRVARIMSAWRRERPDLDTNPQGIIGRLHRLGDALTRELVPVYNSHGLGEGDFDVLATLRRTGAPFELQPSELALHTMVTSGAMTKRIDRLEAAGLVTRRPSGTDGRARVVALA